MARARLRSDPLGQEGGQATGKGGGRGRPCDQLRPQPHTAGAPSAVPQTQRGAPSARKTGAWLGPPGTDPSRCRPPRAAEGGSPPSAASRCLGTAAAAPMPGKTKAGPKAGG